MSLAGIVRYRKHQFGRQASFGTAVPAVSAEGFKGVPTVDPHWTDPDIDLGSLDLVADPYPAAPDLTATYTSPALRYNQLPLIHSGFFGGGVDPTGAGTAQTWLYEPSSETVDDPDVFTIEDGDDELNDWFQLRDSIEETVEIAGPEGLGPLTYSGSWRGGHVGSTGSTDFPETGTVPTPDLAVEPSEAIVFLKDMGLYIASDPDDLDTSQITNALHAFVMRWTGDVDQKRYANADQSFDVDAFARVTRMLELELLLAKTSDTVGVGSESDAWLSKTPVTRYISLVFTSELIAEEGTPDVPFSWTWTAPMRYYTRATEDSGGNSVIRLLARAFFDKATFEKVLSSTVVCTRDQI